MKPRNPTPHELKLWRESNRFTRKKKDAPEIEVAAEECFDDLITASPAPLAGEVRRGVLSTHKTKGKTAPTPHPNPLPQGERELKPLATREANKRLKGYPEIDATLDLHGLTKLEAYDRVRGFVTRNYRAGKRHLLIITGKGRLGEGILRTELPHWLNEPSLRSMISAFTHGKPEKGGNGVTHVLVKKYRD